MNRTYIACQLCEPQMGRRGLYSTLGLATITEAVRNRMDILTYCDGQHNVLAIAEKLGLPAWELAPYFDELVEHGLIKDVAAAAA